MKRLLSLFLALVMSLSLAVPALADEPDNGNEGIELHMQLFENANVSDSTGTYHTDRFTSTPQNGKYIKVWYRNTSDQLATVSLYVDGETDPVTTMQVQPNYGVNEIWYEGSNTEAVTYYVRIQSKLSGPVTGYLAVGQKTSK